MFDIGFGELVLIFVIALIVVGPERLPRVARTAGLWIRKARRIIAEVRDEVERELRVEELKRSITQQGPVDEIKKLADRVKSINTDIPTELKSTVLSNPVSLDKAIPKPPANSSPPDSSPPNPPIK